MASRQSTGRRRSKGTDTVKRSRSRRPRTETPKNSTTAPTQEKQPSNATKKEIRQRSHGIPPQELALTFHRLCRAGNEPARVRMLIKDKVANLEARDKSGRTPLYWAMMGDALTNLKTLLDAKADPSSVDDEGHTLLHHASQKRDDVVLDLFLRHGGWKVVNFKENEMWETPLHFAAMFGSPRCCELLLRHKADPGLFTLGGETAADLARQFKFPAVAQLLRRLADDSVASKWKRTEKAVNFRLKQKDAKKQLQDEAIHKEREIKERQWREEDTRRREEQELALREAAAIAEREKIRLREERVLAAAERGRLKAREEQQRKVEQMEQYEVEKEQRYKRMLLKEREKRAEEMSRIHRDWRKADELMARQEEQRKKEAQAALLNRVDQT